MPKNVCSFCGRSESEVKLLITGIKGYICENCAKQAYDIVLSSGVLNDKKNDKFALKQVPKPVEIKQYLDQYIIGGNREEQHHHGGQHRNGKDSSGPYNRQTVGCAFHYC